MSEIKKLLTIHGFSEQESEKTYARWYNWLNDMLSEKDTKEFYNAIEESPHSDLVVVRDIDIALVCPHHLLPVIAKVSIGYVPDGKILGLSKFARIAQALGRSITQETYTYRLVNDISSKLEPKFVMAYVSATHTCMCIRGVKSANSKTVTKCHKYNSISSEDERKYAKEFIETLKLEA